MSYTPDPERMLDRFEEKHGEYAEILDRYCRAASKADHFPATDAEKAERRKLEGLLRHHTKLVWLYIGYWWGQQAVRQGSA